METPSPQQDSNVPTNPSPTPQEQRSVSLPKVHRTKIVFLVFLLVLLIALFTWLYLVFSPRAQNETVPASSDIIVESVLYTPTPQAMADDQSELTADDSIESIETDLSNTTFTELNADFADLEAEADFNE